MSLLRHEPPGRWNPWRSCSRSRMRWRTRRPRATRSSRSGYVAKGIPRWRRCSSACPPTSGATSRASCTGREKTKGRHPIRRRSAGSLRRRSTTKGPATAHPRLLSAYRALSMAVRNEERAFAFWSYVAAHAGDADIRHAAETMAHEELGHVATLRRERRSAFHAERRHAFAVRAPRMGRGPCGAGAAACRSAGISLGQGSPQERARLAGFDGEASRHAEELERDPIAMGGGKSGKETRLIRWRWPNC